MIAFIFYKFSKFITNLLRINITKTALSVNTPFFSYPGIKNPAGSTKVLSAGSVCISIFLSVLLTWP